MEQRKLIVLAGHNRAGWKKYPHFSDPGAVSGVHDGNKDNEHYLMERLVSPPFTELKKEHDNIYLMDFTYNLQGKIDWINKNCTKFDCVVEFHANAAQDYTANGSEVFYIENGIRSYTWSKRLIDIICHNMDTKNRGIKTSNNTRHGRLGIIDDTVTYDFLIELGFITNQSDYNKIKVNGQKTVQNVCEYLLHNIK